MSIGKSFVAAVLAEGSVSSLLQYGPIDELFRANEIELYKFVREHVKKYAALPNDETISAHLNIDLPEPKEPSAYYLDLLEKRNVEFVLKKGMGEANGFLTADNKQPEKALAVIMEAAMKLAAQKHAKQIVDFRQAYDVLVPDYASKWNQTEDIGLHFGWPTLDAMSGGAKRGDLISFVGRPQRGKTWQMLYSAMHGWKKAGKDHAPAHDQSRMFVSMEMDPLAIQERLAAIQTGQKMSNITHAALGTTGWTNYKKGLAEIKGYGAPFYVVDGNLAATVEDIWMMVRQLKPAALFIDGGYLVKHPTERDRYRRVAENAELMKKELTPLCPTCVSWQFAKTASQNKGGKKGDDQKKPTMDDIGYTDAIAQVSSLVLGLLEEESVATLKQRLIDVLKGRKGETGQFRTNWNFDVMDFSEVVESDVSDLKFI